MRPEVREMLPCPDETELDDFVRGALPPAALASMDAHLARCVSCSELVGLLASSHTRPVDGGARTSDGPAREGDSVGPYVLRARLGEGAAGVVFTAWDPRLAREVALKLVRPERAGDPAARERMLREAQAMARLSHPNVVTVFDAGTDGARVFIAMEVVRGATLRAVIEQGPLGWRRAVQLAREAGEGLAAAHAAGVLHRDVKPENVVVGSDRVRLTDFGLAGEVAGRASVGDAVDAPALTRTGALIGTPLYMAPELLDGAAASERSDLFSLGVTLYEALAGARPFGGRTVGELRASVKRGAAKIPGVPRGVDNAVRAALREDPSRRPASVRAWLALLDRAQRPVLARVGVVMAGLAGLGVAGLVTAHRAPPRCEAGAALAQRVADPRRTGAVRGAFARADARYGATAAAALLGAVERWRGAWARSYDDACRAARVERSESEELFAARGACLTAALREVDATLASLAGADRGAVLRAQSIADDLPSLEACSDRRALASMVTPPTDARRRASLGEAEDAVFRSVADEASGQSARAIEGARRAVALAEAARFGPVESRAHRALARALRGAGAFDEAQREARRAALIAEAARDDRGAARAWLELVATLGARGSWAETLANIEQAQAAVTRLGEPAARASLALMKGLALTNLGRLAEARASLDEALALRERSGDPSPVLTALANVDREEGRLESALARHARAMELDRARTGEDHPEQARHRHNIAGVLRRMGRREEARARYLEALAIEQRWLGDDSAELALTRNSLGLLALEGGAFDEAARWLSEAERVLSSGTHGGLVAVNLALVALGRGDAVGAEREARGAVEREERAFGAAHLRTARARKVLGLALEGQGRNAEARAAFEGAIAALGARADEDARLVREESTAGLARLAQALSERSVAVHARERPPVRPAVRRVRAPEPEPVAAPEPAAPAAVQRPIDPEPEPAPEPVARPTVAPAPVFRPPPGSGGYGAAQRWNP